jgi:hypothetical protein
VSPDVLWNLGLIPLGAAFLNGCGVLFYTRYRLDKKRHAEIMAVLLTRRAAKTVAAGSPDPASPARDTLEPPPGATPPVPAE